VAVQLNRNKNMGILEGRFLQSLDIACLGTLGCVRAQSTNIWQTVLALGEQFWFSATFGFSVTSSTEYSFKVSDSSLWLSWCISAHSSLWLSRWISAHSSLATQGMSYLIKSLVRILTVEVEQLGSSLGVLRSCCRSRNFRLHLCWQLKHSYDL